MTREPTDPGRASLGYESGADRAHRSLPVSISMTMIICGTAVIVAPYAFHSQVDFRYLFQDLLRATFMSVTFVVGLAMIALGYWHGRR